MVARSPSHAGDYMPAESARVAVAADGTVAAVCEPSRITLLALPEGVAFAEIDADPEALASEVGWLGAPPRLLVLSRYAAYSTAHLLDPQGPRPIAEIRLETPMRLFATVGASALVVGGLGAAVLAASEAYLTAYPFPTRSLPITAGAAAGQFVVAMAASIEEWDPQSRMPRRRLRLPRAAAITAVGGSERIVWMTTQQEPSRIDVIPMINRSQPRAHELPEPIASAAGHPRSDLVACIGAESGRVYVVDLDGRQRLRILPPDGDGRIESAALVLGRMTGVLAAQAGRAVMIAHLDGRDGGDPAGRRAPSAEPAGAPPAETQGPSPAEPADAPTEAQGLSPAGPAAAGAGDEPVPALGTQSAAGAGDEPVPAPGAQSAAGAGDEPVPAPGAPSRRASTGESRPMPSASARFSAWRNLVRQSQSPDEPVTRDSPPAAAADVPAPAVPAVSAAPTARAVIAAPPAATDPATRAAPSAPAAPAGPVAAAREDRGASWRDEVVTWTQAIAAGTIDAGAPAAPPIEALIARFDLAPALHPVLVRLYGAHLCGERGVAPAEVARLLDHQWDEALGRGELAERGVAEYAGSRVALSPPVLRALDELPPATGVLVGRPGSITLLGPCVVIAGDEPLVAIAERCASQLGGEILAATGEPARAELVLEARARGAAPMLRAVLDAAPRDAAIFVIDDAELAERLGLPRLA
ncbi:MAG TPA: hypothetical protein VHT91_23510 [Kofleriaceae bacterium]|nr:hypothetical protein [Kofleriaceae bacterium]